MRHWLIVLAMPVTAGAQPPAAPATKSRPVALPHEQAAVTLAGGMPECTPLAADAVQWVVFEPTEGASAEQVAQAAAALVAQGFPGAEVRSAKGRARVFAPVPVAELPAKLGAPLQRRAFPGNISGWVCEARLPGAKVPAGVPHLARVHVDDHLCAAAGLVMGPAPGGSAPP